jgi:ribosomal protein S27AE
MPCKVMDQSSYRHRACPRCGTAAVHTLNIEQLDAQQARLDCAVCGPLKTPSGLAVDEGAISTLMDLWGAPVGPIPLRPLIEEVYRYNRLPLSGAASWSPDSSSG